MLKIDCLLQNMVWQDYIKDYGDLNVPSVESIKRDIQALGAAGKEEILNYLEEVVILGSFATEATSEVK